MLGINLELVPFLLVFPLVTLLTSLPDTQYIIIIILQFKELKLVTPHQYILFQEVESFICNFINFHFLVSKDRQESGEPGTPSVSTPFTYCLVPLIPSPVDQSYGLWSFYNGPSFFLEGPPLIPFFLRDLSLYPRFYILSDPGRNSTRKSRLGFVVRFL